MQLHSFLFACCFIFGSRECRSNLFLFDDNCCRFNWVPVLESDDLFVKAKSKKSDDGQ